MVRVKVQDVIEYLSGNTVISLFGRLIATAKTTSIPGIHYISNNLRN